MLKKGFTRMMSFVLLMTCFSSPIRMKVVEGAAITDTAMNGWELVWSDEFNGTELDRSIWNVEVNGYGGWNNELQYYCDSPENLSVSDGTLKITALKKSYLGKDYTSARINSEGKAEFQYGRIEAKMKLPCFKGAWPAFWMLGANNSTASWPACGEIDIMEAVNDESIVYGTAHWEYGDGYDSSGSSSLAAGADIDITQWHTYGIEWNENQIIWYVDDIKYYALAISSEKEMEELALDQFLILNLAVGGDWPGFEIDDTAIPATMEVDYVRVYQKNNTDMEVPTIAVTEDIVEQYTGTWTSSIGSWAGAAGTVTSTENPQDGFEAKMTAVGTDIWGAQASLSNLSYRAGNTYTYRCTLISDIDKNIFIKVEGDNNSELAGDYVSLQANVPYYYETAVFIPNTYTGSLSLFFFFGGGINNETISFQSTLNFRVQDVSFSTTTTVTNPNYPEEETTEKTTEAVVSNVKVEINGYQISAINEGFRTLYTIDDPDNEVVNVGMIYGLNDVSDSDMIVGSTNNMIYNYDATELGKMDISLGDTDTSKSYAMTMALIKSQEFYNSKFHIRAYAKLSDGTYQYSNVFSCTVYQIADYMYQNVLMTNFSGHDYLYNSIIKIVHPSYPTKEFPWKNSLA